MWFQLAVRVRYHEQLSPVCLPPAERALAPGTLCTVIGWGKRDDKDSQYITLCFNDYLILII